ncbi:MAG: rhodanese-like domain-containing protein [Granulosicoccus sp.]
MSGNAIVNISGYRFVRLDNLHNLQHVLNGLLSEAGVKGSVVLAEEGINVTLAGELYAVESAMRAFDSQPSLRDIWFKRSLSSWVPHKRLRVRIRKQIIGFDEPVSVTGESKVAKGVAPSITSGQLKRWLDTNRQFTLLDTRNDYEIESGTFRQAKHLDIKHFRHFASAASGAIERGELDISLPVVAFCTGGIRCEKAGPWLVEQGFREVYQVQGGVINYLQETQGEHWDGECFVFDERVELDRNLQPTGAGLCEHCQLAVPKGTECRCHLGPHYHASDA